MTPHIIAGGSQTVPGRWILWSEVGGEFPCADGVTVSAKRRKSVRLAHPTHGVVWIALEGALERQQRALRLAEIAKCVCASPPGQRAARIKGDGAISGDERFTVAIHLMEGNAASHPGACVAWEQRDGAI